MGQTPSSKDSGKMMLCLESIQAFAMAPQQNVLGHARAQSLLLVGGYVSATGTKSHTTVGTRGGPLRRKTHEEVLHFSERLET